MKQKIKYQLKSIPRNRSTGLIRAGLIGGFIGSLITTPLVFGFAQTESRTLALVDSRLGYFRECESKLITNMLDAKCAEYLRAVGLEPDAILTLAPPRTRTEIQQEIIMDKISEGKPNV